MSLLETARETLGVIVREVIEMIAFELSGSRALMHITDGSTSSVSAERPPPHPTWA